MDDLVNKKAALAAFLFLPTLLLLLFVTRLLSAKAIHIFIVR